LLSLLLPFTFVGWAPVVLLGRGGGRAVAGTRPVGAEEEATAAAAGGHHQWELQ